MNKNTEHSREWRTVNLTLPVPEHVHGTRNGYQNYGCRCDECRAANTAWMNDYNRRRRGQREAEGRE